MISGSPLKPIAAPGIPTKPIIDISYHFIGEEQYFTLEPCEFGKNLNSKYKEVIEKLEKVDQLKLKDFYCINYRGLNVTLYSHPFLSYKDENYLEFRLSSECQNFILNFQLS